MMLMRSRVVGIAVIVLSFGTLSSATTALSASYDPLAGKPDDTISIPSDVEQVATPSSQTEANRVSLEAASAEIADAVGDSDVWDPSRPDGGYLWQVIDVDSGSIDLYWKGDPPGTIAEISTRFPSVSVRIHRVEYSENEFLGSQAAIMAGIDAELPGGVQFAGVMHEPDRSALNVLLTGLVKNNELSTLTAWIDRSSDVPARVYVVDPEDVPTPLYNRQADEPQWWGGSQIGIAGGLCSTAFSIVMNGTGNRYLTTAGHCIGSTTGNVTTAAGKALGVWKNQPSWVRREYDAALVQATDNNYGHSVYGGNAWSSTNYAITTAQDSPAAGGIVYTSGANSGEHALTVVAKNEGYRNPITDVPLAGHVRARASGTSIAVVKGDSGGPVILKPASGSKVGLGIISMGESTTSTGCDSSTIANVPTTCFNYVIYTSLTGLLGSMNARVAP